ncbi:hypothetical protein Q9966_012094 [Columba livia]|nr:hypothetical protein Q9966_012094 [Columba livia]
MCFLSTLGYSCSTKSPRCAWCRLNQACPRLNHIHPVHGEEVEVLHVSAPYGQNIAVSRFRQHFSNDLKTESMDRGSNETQNENMQPSKNRLQLLLFEPKR